MKQFLTLIAICGVLAGCTAAPDLPLDTKPALTLRTGQPLADVYRVFLDQQGLIRRLITVPAGTTDYEDVLDLTKTDGRLEATIVDAAENEFPFAVTWKEDLVELLVGGEVTQSVTVGTEPGQLWKTSRVSAWGDENSYQELPVYPTYDERAEPTVFRWYGLYLREKHLADDEVFHQLGPLENGYLLITNHRESPEHDWIPGNITTAEGPGLHNKDLKTNVINLLILGHVTGKVVQWMPSVWGWSPMP